MDNYTTQQHFIILSLHLKCQLSTYDFITELSMTNKTRMWLTAAAHWVPKPPKSTEEAAEPAAEPPPSIYRAAKNRNNIYLACTTSGLEMDPAYSYSPYSYCMLQPTHQGQESQLHITWYGNVNKNKRSKNFDNRQNRRQKIMRRSQDRGKAVDNRLSQCWLWRTMWHFIKILYK